MRTFAKRTLGVMAACVFIGLTVNCNSSTQNSADNNVNIESTVEESQNNAHVAVSDWGDGTVREISQDEFYKLVARKDQSGKYIGQGPAVVDFWASWCIYCQKLTPNMEQMAKKYKGKVQFYKVDADQCGDLCQSYDIEGLPTLFFCNATGIEVRVGYYEKEELDGFIKAIAK